MKKFLLFISLFFAAACTYAQYTGFQRSLNDKPWGVAKIDRSKGPVLAGQYSERFELRQGDCGSQPGWSDCTTDRERTEMSELQPYTKLGVPTWYSWSFYLDPAWPDISPVTTTIGQFHQRDQSTPAVLFVQRNGIYMMRIESAKALYPGRDIINLLEPGELRGRWHTVVVYALWSTGNDGKLQVWINGRRAANISGPNTLNTTPIFFKYGIYRSFVSRQQVRPPHIAYIDEVRKGPTRESVDPTLGRYQPN